MDLRMAETAASVCTCKIKISRKKGTQTATMMAGNCHLSSCK